MLAGACQILGFPGSQRLWAKWLSTVQHLDVRLHATHSTRTDWSTQHGCQRLIWTPSRRKRLPQVLVTESARSVRPPGLVRSDRCLGPGPCTYSHALARQLECRSDGQAKREQSRRRQGTWTGRDRERYLVRVDTAGVFAHGTQRFVSTAELHRLCRSAPLTSALISAGGTLRAWAGLQLGFSMSSALKNAVKRKTHKERSQP